jgi:phospholipid transport system substrate-binding protein
MPAWTRALLPVVLALVAAPTPGPAAPEPSTARAPVERLYAELLAVMKHADELGYEGRMQRLAPVVADAYDLPFMAAKVLGRHWRNLDEAMQRRWIDTFARLTVSTYADRFDGFSGERLEVQGAKPSAMDTVVVHTVIEPVDEDPVSVDYRLHERAGGWRIVDVYLNGTVSELALRRSEYSSVVKREGIEALIAQLETKIADPRAEDAPS